MGIVSSEALRTYAAAMGIPLAVLTGSGFRNAADNYFNAWYNAIVKIEEVEAGTRSKEQLPELIRIAEMYQENYKEYAGKAEIEKFIEEQTGGKVTGLAPDYVSVDVAGVRKQFDVAGISTVMAEVSSAIDTFVATATVQPPVVAQPEITKEITVETLGVPVDLSTLAVVGGVAALGIIGIMLLRG